MGAPAALESLPGELIFSIAEHLSVDELRRFRLSSPLLADATQPLLALAVFNGIPWRSEVERLHELSRLPLCGRRIHSVSFNLARLDEYTALHQAFSRLWFLEPQVRAARFEEERRIFGEATHSFAAVPAYRGDLVETALLQLPNLKHLTLTWVRNPWEDGEGLAHYFDPEASIRHFRAAAAEVQQGFLDVLWKMKTPLESLTIGGIILRDLSMPSETDGRVVKSLASLKHCALTIAFVDTEPFPNQILERLLLRMPNLTSLSMEFMTARGTPPVPEFLPTIVFPYLETVHLTSLGYETHLAAEFLLRHAATLRRVRLRSLKEESWGDIWLSIREMFPHLEDEDVPMA
ncbi:hypothetical protein S40288_06240 [Stachybotrys chartarum IBT 40288]|nr:hypothetical protein S40288_06240 [Stachybotrys chartarum IBT 40288]